MVTSTVTLHCDLVALVFLKESGVVEVEQERVYPSRLHRAEKNIANYISKRLRSTPSPFPLEFDREPLSALASDPDQVGLGLSNCGSA